MLKGCIGLHWCGAQLLQAGLLLQNISGFVLLIRHETMNVGLTEKFVI